MRLDKYLSEMGAASRREIREACRREEVLINGCAVTDSGTQVDPGHDRVTWKGKEIAYETFSYYMMNKPAGVVSAVRDPRERTVLDLLPAMKRKDLFPVGRLDKDTEGLLIITNNGPLSQRLLSPKRHVPKTYYARVQGMLTEEHVRLFEQGIGIGDEDSTKPAKLSILSAGEYSEAEVTLTEGRFHQVKRMFHAVGCEVAYLKRLSMGTVTLDPTLLPGEWRRLTCAELTGLFKSAGIRQ